MRPIENLKKNFTNTNFSKPVKETVNGCMQFPPLLLFHLQQWGFEAPTVLRPHSRSPCSVISLTRPLRQSEAGRRCLPALQSSKDAAGMFMTCVNPALCLLRTLFALPARWVAFSRHVLALTHYKCICSVHKHKGVHAVCIYSST